PEPATPPARPEPTNGLRASPPAPASTPPPASPSPSTGWRPVPTPPVPAPPISAPTAPPPFAPPPIGRTGFTSPSAPKRETTPDDRPIVNNGYIEANTDLPIPGYDAL